MNILLVIFGKLFSFVSIFLNIGSGSTWPGHIAIAINKNFIKDLLKNSKTKIILVAGTNGKTTTGKLIQTIFEHNKKSVFQNKQGANLLNGIASALISNSTFFGKIDKNYAIFEIDENTLPLILNEIKNPNYIVVLNLFRDQLDRYGEVNIIASKWKNVFKNLTPKTTLILNADDPQIMFLGTKTQASVKYFGINPKKIKKTHQHASDSTYCPNCGKKLSYSAIYFSHLGNWKCNNCFLKLPIDIETNSPIYPLIGIYNQYNINASFLLAKLLGFDKEKILDALREFSPAFGRQETINIDNKKAQIFLSKNPTGLNESLRTVADLKAKNVLFVLNDRIPDGQDVSWIWDVDFEEFVNKFQNIFISGDRCYDMAIRIKYSLINQNHNLKLKVFDNLQEAIKKSLDSANDKEALYILPTYSAMLETRKILTGKKIF